MAEPLEKTMNFLAHTRNQAAVRVLIAALNSNAMETRVTAIRGLVERRSSVGHTQLLERFSHFGEPEQAAFAEGLRHTSHHMKPALQDVLLSDQHDLSESACHAILLGRLYDLLPTLIAVAEKRKHRHSDQAAATLVRLARLLQQEISGDICERTCDPFFARRQVLPAVERSAVKYGEHERLEIIDAFLLLVPPHSTTLINILGNSRHSSHQPAIDSLASSSVTSVMDLIAQLIHDTKVANGILEIVAKRHERKFLDYLLHHVGEPVSLRVLENMKRLSSITWLEDAKEALLALDGAAQAAAVQIATAAKISRLSLFELLAMILERGQPEGRVASCDAMARFHDERADHYVLEALDDSDPRVQAAAARQLRRRRLPDAMEKLVSMLDLEPTEVRDAARSSLAEFNFMRYQTSFEDMDELTRQSTGRLVRKIDPSAGPRLAELLASPSPSTRFRGLEMVIAMEAADLVFDDLERLLDDCELGVRTDVVTALGQCTHQDALTVLRKGAHDTHHCVREAAEISMQRIKERRERDISQHKALTRDIE